MGTPAALGRQFGQRHVQPGGKLGGTDTEGLPAGTPDGGVLHDHAGRLGDDATVVWLE
ncbi:hypothetical protein [Streptomyces sp. NPDC052693]|uniref:hypothetical protein n=1 Tax=Streptomyces sp. NPDC052693 TaxID=3155814 RepID=UPI003412EA2D